MGGCYIMRVNTVTLKKPIPSEMNNKTDKEKLKMSLYEKNNDIDEEINETNPTLDTDSIKKKIYSIFGNYYTIKTMYFNNKYTVNEEINDINNSLASIYNVFNNKIKETRRLRILRKSNENKNDNSILSGFDLIFKIDSNKISRMYECFECKLNYYIITERDNSINFLDFILNTDNPEFYLNERKICFIMKQLVEAVDTFHNINIQLDKMLKINNLQCVLGSKDNFFDITIKLFSYFPYTNTAFDKISDSYTENVYFNTAPEVIMEKIRNKKSDIWSCGIIMFLLFCGKLPYVAKTANEIINKMLCDRLEDQVYLIPISESGLILLKKLLSYDFESRPSAKETLDNEWFNIIKINQNDKNEKIDKNDKNYLNTDNANLNINTKDNNLDDLNDFMNVKLEFEAENFKKLSKRIKKYYYRTTTLNSIISSTYLRSKVKYYEKRLKENAKSFYLDEGEITYKEIIKLIYETFGSVVGKIKLKYYLKESNLTIDSKFITNNFIDFFLKSEYNTIEFNFKENLQKLTNILFINNHLIDLYELKTLLSDEEIGMFENLYIFFKEIEKNSVISIEALLDIIQAKS